MAGQVVGDFKGRIALAQDHHPLVGEPFGVDPVGFVTLGQIDSFDIFGNAGGGCSGRWKWEVWRSSVYTDIVDFKWGPRKAAGNLRKDGIDFHEAATVLDDTFSTTFPDTDHSTTPEARFLSIGMANRGRILVVAHADERAGTIRIITARRATGHERRFYEEG